jgi:hypothetical protein
MRKSASSQSKASDFYAEAEYADSMFRAALGDREGSVAALRRTLE